VRSPSETGRRGRWPRSLDEPTTHPRDVAPEWAQHMQGVALTEDWWFITQEDRLWRLPTGGDLADTAGDSVRRAGIPCAGIEHLGDCDFRDGRLYVAMEGTNPARMGVFDTDLEFIGSAAAGDQGSSNPWCAVDPLTGLLYSSPFDTDHLVTYEVSVERDRVDLRPSQPVPLRTADGAALELERVQGGAFTPSGQLYLTVDSGETAIVGVDVDTGRQMLHHRIEREPGWPDHHVVEGLAYGALDGRSADRMGGQIHVLVLIGGGQPDYLWFRHYDERY
jgi:hypothetical protein